MMPGMDGLELTRRLRADPMITALPIIMLTAKGLTADKVAGLTAGADDYMVKPFDTSELVARVRSTLRRNQEVREVSPLTGLPGNTRILREIADRLQGGRRLRGLLHRHRPVQERQRRVRLRPRRRVHQRAGPLACTGPRSPPGCRRPSSATSAATTSSSSATPTRSGRSRAGGRRLRGGRRRALRRRRTPSAATSSWSTAAATSSRSTWSRSRSGWRCPRRAATTIRARCRRWRPR